MIRPITSSLGALICLCVLVQGTHGAEVSLSLNLEPSNSGDLSSGGTWTVVVKADERGLQAVVFNLDNSTLDFNPATGLLTPTGFEIVISLVIGPALQIIQGDDGSDKTLDVGVIGGTFPTSYVDDPNLTLLGSNPDLGSFTGGVELATGSFSPGQIPSWIDGGDGFFAAANIFDSSLTVVGLQSVSTTVRYVVPEPTAMMLLAIGLLCSAGLPWRRRS